MGVLEGPEDLNGEMHRFLPADVLLLIDILLERDAIDILHDNVLQAVAEAHIVYLDNIRMGKNGNRFGFILKPAGEFLVGEVFILKDFYSIFTK